MQIEFDIGKIIWTCLVYGFIAIFIGISQAAGIGGGPIINICLIIGLGYETKTSMAITYVFLIGGSIASIYSNYGKKTPNKRKNVIDANLVLMTLPMTASGSICGVLFNHFVSDFFISVAFTTLLSYLAYTSYLKFLQSKKSELKVPLTTSTISIQLNELGIKPKINPKLQKILEEELIAFPPSKLKIYILIIIITLIATLVKGGSSFESIIGLQKCGFGTNICVIIHFIICYTAVRKIGAHELETQRQKISLGYSYENQEDRITENFMNKALIVGFAGGFAGGMLGIGGAIIQVPVWLQMGIDKAVVSGSSAPLILASSFTSMITALLCGFYDSFIMVIFYLCLSFVASFYIKELINGIKQKYKLQGMIFILLVIVMGMSLLFLLPYSFVKMLNNPGDFFKLGHFC